MTSSWCKSRVTSQRASEGRQPARVRYASVVSTTPGLPSPTARGATGHWTLRANVTASETHRGPDVRNEDRTEMLQTCQAGGQELVRGSLIAVHSGGSIQTVNRIDTENMLRSVIAREMSPSWSNAGGGRGLPSAGGTSRRRPVVHECRRHPVEPDRHHLRWRFVSGIQRRRSSHERDLDLVGLRGHPHGPGGPDDK